MYSVVLMMAITGGGDVPAGLFDHGCGGGHGCMSSCFSCGGGHGCFSSGHGCMGSKHSCFSCGGGHGCFSSGHGCMGCGGGHKCFSHKSHGCCGAPVSCGCCGAPVNCGCCGTPVNCGCAAPVSYGCAGGTVVPTTVAPPLAPAPAPAPAPKKTSIDGAAPATLVVNVPADARLTIDDEATTSTSTQRVFVSPELNAGRDYHYTVRAEFVKDGKVVKVSKEVAVQAGNQTNVTLDAENLAGVASR